ncbi:uncharacterized protein LOC116349684 [Contarinia nasturtii]|uniref:uncharacterized protein LOC116349684 n=1 Tax=Contarinia nasturtii TaxID=265458 RepID=UPI0012D3E671|nr:uncharacterized protein LOC116349684 [Contarinia nasturtii]
MNMEVDEDIEEKYKILLNHVVLPRFLPQNRSEHLCSEELALVSAMVKNVTENELLTQHIPPATIKMLNMLNEVHKNLSPNTVSQQIQSLKPGDTFGMFVRRQNCGIMIHMPVDFDQSKRVIVATFPGNIHPKHIYSNDSDIKFNYPIQSLNVPFSKLICSEEFADQLCFMYQDLPIETKNRNYVSKWLVTLLTDQISKTATTNEFPIITKKIRDEVLGKHSNNFFRRSSFYMCLKVFLQHNLTMVLGQDQAKLLYKLIMMQFLTRMIDTFQNEMHETLDVDLLTQCMAKLARRIEKLLDLMKHSEVHDFDELHQNVQSQAKKTIQEIRHKINNQINKLQTDDENRARLLPLVDLDFHADVEQKIPKLLGYLEKRKCATDSNRNRSELKVKKLSRHYRKETNAPTVSVFKQLTNETERNLYANDFEIWVLYQLNVECISFRPDELRAWIFDYTFAVDNLYKGDELGTSRMILVYLKLIAALDKIACRTYPILKQHRTSINPNIINSLLLPQREDMAIAFELEQYFKKRNANATGPGLIEEKSVSVNSFSVKFAEQSADMQNVVTQIKRIEEHGIACKRQEWQCGRDEVQSLRNQDQRMVHTNYTNYRYGYTRHDKFCKKCVVEKEIRNMRIDMYERPLPTETYEQNAVAFELRCPIEIACLRDVLFSFTKLCENPKGFEFASLVDAANRRGWVAYHQINQFNVSNSMFISLGGSNSSYKYKEHVDSSFECFVVKNGIGCTFYGSQSTLPSAISDECINTVCTLPVENEYKSLQWTLNGTHHTQNEVLSRQNECHERLTLSEFKNFGSLRADGHRLQLRKLYAMIETEALSLEQSSVLSLVIQTLWEAGIAGDDGAIRESHTDFNDSKFAAAMIELLDKFCEQQKKNWVHPNKLLIAALIAVRVFEMNDDETLADQIVNLLDKIRSIAFDWIEKITHAIKESTNSSLHSDKQLHMKLLSVSIAGAMTFFINYNHTFFEKIFVENKQTKYSAPRVWIQFIITMNNNILSNANQNEMPLNLRLLLRMVRNIGIHIEPTIRSMIEGCMPMPNDIYRLVKQLWSRVDCARSIQSYFYSDYPQTLVFEVLLKGFANYITIDIITGEFLVNNRPVVHSPTTITEAEIFQRTFGNFVFAVQPDSAYTFSTVQKYNNCNYEFQCENETLIIERRDGIEKEIVPPSVLANEIPHHLIENYSHFWNKQTNVIEFRPKLFSDKNFSNQDGIEYQLDLNERRLIHMKTQRLMLDITSGSYLKIATHLSRLEVPKFIHVLMDKPQVATVELIRMRLKFTVDASARRQIYDMESNEFAGMRVGLAQKCGTLYGFHHGLLLESMPNENSITNASKKLLIIPHGEIQTEHTNLHVSVKVKINGDLRNPPFHQYEIDEFCSQIKASSSNYSAWFFLAYLHAVTSHGEMEPFTKMSGTECALQILQSGFAWASAPYDEDATKMLDAIAKLSPNRKMKEFYQQVEWPSIIPPRSAQDTYILIAHRLLEDSQRLHELYFIPKMKTLTTNILNKRQYLRSLPFIPNLRISETFAKYEKLRTSKASFPFETPSNETRTISVLYHNQKYVVPKGLNLKGFLMSNDTLDGTANMENVKLLLHHQIYQKFVDLWIPLYEYARRGMFNKEQFALIWSVLSHENNSLDPILALQAIQMNPQAFCSIDLPPIEKYQIGEGMEYDVNVVRNILGSYHTRPFSLYYSMDSPERLAYDERIKQAIENMISSINWPCDGIKLHCDVSEINVAEASLAISQRLKIWNNNRKLALFIQQVQETLECLPASDPLTFNELKYVEFCSMDWQKYEIDYKMKMCERIDDFEEVIQEAQSIWVENSANLVKSVDFWWSVYENIVNGSNSQHLIDAGMFPRAVPSLVLPAITAKEDNPLKMVVGALAVTIVHEQRQKRIALYSQQDHLKGALTREMQNEPHVNWKPCEYPEWVLFEIEQNLMIRRIQVDVARQMMAPQKNCEKKHSVMQLNMGEGKTAVITPIVAAILANGKEACQITVLKPLFATNLKSLRRYLGGMLKRRLYIFPCRRNMKIEKHVSEMLKIYEECKQMKGIILTLPEYRLSFQLKIYESIQKSDYRAAAYFLQVHKWIEANVRNILDESDAILHPKYQLVYTLGTQSSLEENRWLIAQAVLKRIPYHMKKLYIQFGPEKIEFDENYIKKGQIFGAPKVNHRDDVFTPCRILDGSVYEELKSLLIEDFLSGRINIAFQEMKPNTKNELRFLLREKSIDKNTFHQIMDVFLTEERDIIMILSGLLRFEILKLVLMKRWRVNYGVNEKGQRKTLREGGRKMAIPFKAKDVAAEQTEFGHPDVAI